MTRVLRQIDSWADLEIGDLVYAFRKAKADCFFDRIIFAAEKFAEYESRLYENLSALLSELQSKNVERVFARNAGGFRVVAKKLGIAPRDGSDLSEDQGHTYFSDSSRAFERLCIKNKVVPEFRLIGDFSVELHILSALWINTVGHSFDATLSSSAYGSRLRRCKREPDTPDDSVGAFHYEAIGSFEKYFSPYKRWRENGLKAIRQELAVDRAVIAISLDFVSYYHQIDPRFFSNARFHAAIGVALTPWQAHFNDALVHFLCQWSERAVAVMQEMGLPALNNMGGIPIGVSATRIVANALLVELDSDIERGLAPIYYGRYVDDIFLVIRDPGDIVDANGVLRFLAERTRCFSSSDIHGNDVALKLPNEYQGGTVLLLQKSKQKAFFLKGSGGLDLLDNIESQIRSVSSERRLMPSVERLGSMASAKVLSAAGHPSEEADTLRRADGLSVRRLSWSLQLKAVEILARDLRENDWLEERREFYRFALTHILRPDKILDHMDYLPRLLSLAVALMDWGDARRIFDASIAALSRLKEGSTNGYKINGMPTTATADETWIRLEATVRDMAGDAVLRSIRWDAGSGKAREISQTGLRLCALLGIGATQNQIEEKALILREADWAKTAYKDHLRRTAARQRPRSETEIYLWSSYSHLEDLLDFLQSSQQPVAEFRASRVHSRCHGERDASLLPFLFPTRAYSTQEISLFLPDECIFASSSEAAQAWGKYARAVRGVWVWGVAGPTAVVDAGKNSNGPLQVANLGGQQKREKVLLGISSLSTEDSSWAAAATGPADLSRERYARLESIVNQAVSACPRPMYLLLPELALPERWIDTVSGVLRASGISLIAGLDYQRSSPHSLHSSAVLVLSDYRLGFPASVEVRQVKTLPAPGEEQALVRSFGKEWTNDLPQEKPVYVHDGFAFGVLVCSELQNVNHRLNFQGAVDCLMVLSWNQDLETFSSLVDSASLDVHANVALVNNRRYGDSRVRAPSKVAHARDICRLRGGRNDHVVVVEIEYSDLRAFQSRAKRWPSEADPYKPVPESFAIASFRRDVPSV